MLRWPRSTVVGASAWSGDTAAQATPLASTDATLLALAVTPGSLSPSFDAATLSYGCCSLTARPAPDHCGAERSQCAIHIAGDGNTPGRA